MPRLSVFVSLRRFSFLLIILSSPSHRKEEKPPTLLLSFTYISFFFFLNTSRSLLRERNAIRKSENDKQDFFYRHEINERIILLLSAPFFSLLFTELIQLAPWCSQFYQLRAPPYRPVIRAADCTMWVDDYHTWVCPTCPALRLVSIVTCRRYSERNK